MTRWAKGADRVTAMIEARDLQRVISYDPITSDEADGAIEAARQCLASATRLLELDQLGIF